MSHLTARNQTFNERFNKMFKKRTKIRNWTDEQGVTWGVRQTRTPLGDFVDRGTPFKVNDPNPLPELPASTNPTLAKFNEMGRNYDDRGALNAANLVVGLSGALVAAGVVILIAQEVL